MGRAPGGAMSHPPRILIIDDDADFRAAVRSLLESRGWEVVQADSGKEGLEKLVRRRPDLILLDIMMECCSEGYGVNQAIKWGEEFRAFRHIPIVMVSSIEQQPDELFPMAGEVQMIRPDYYVRKPLDIPAFLETVQQALGRSASGGAGPA
jgi:CheY-like chemotaxis protein